MERHGRMIVYMTNSIITRRNSDTHQTLNAYRWARQRKNIFRKIAILLACGLFCMFYAPSVFASVVIRPSQTDAGQPAIFDVSTDSQKNISTIAVRLLIPQELTDIVPNVKKSWSISLKKTNGQVSEILWSHGNVPPGEREDFYFKAQVPDKETTLIWKAYQFYQDGTVVTYINAPNANDPTQPHYSATTVTDEINSSTTDDTDLSVRVNFAVFLSVIAFILSAASFFMLIKKTRQT